MALPATDNDSIRFAGARESSDGDNQAAVVFDLPQS